MVPFPYGEVVACSGQEERMTQSDILTVQEVCDQYGVKDPAVRRWIREGLIQPVKHPSHKRALGILKGQVERLMVGVCEVCGEVFRRGGQGKRFTLRQSFCSDACRKKAHALGIEPRLPKPEAVSEPEQVPPPPADPKPEPKPKPKKKKVDPLARYSIRANEAIVKAKGWEEPEETG